LIYNYLEPCALNAEFQHFFIPRFNKTSCYFADLTQRGGDRGSKEAQRQGEDRMTFKQNSIRKVVGRRKSVRNVVQSVGENSRFASSGGK